MATTFDKREEGFEKKFAHDEELRFKAMARRNKMLGLWAAGMLGKSGADAEAYAKEVVMADFEEAGDDDVVRKVLKDLAAEGRHRAANSCTHERAAGGGGRADQEERVARPVSRTRCAHWRCTADPGPRKFSIPDLQHFDTCRAGPRNILEWMMTANFPFALARRLRAGETVYGGWCMIGSPVVAETIAREGFAAVVLDAQHGLWDVPSLIAGVGAVNHAGAAPIVRVPHDDFALVSRALDFGAEAIIAPMINTAADAAPIRRPPRNIRRSANAAGDRCAPWLLQGRTAPVDYLREANDGTLTLAMIETADRARQCRSHRRNARHRCAVRRPLRSCHRAQRRHRAGRAGPAGRTGDRQRSAPLPRRPARSPASIAAMPSARWPWPNAASASLSPATTSPSCATATAAQLKALKGRQARPSS